MSTTPITPEVVTLPEGVDVMEQLADGKWHVKLATGEDFTGNDREIMGQMGKAHVSTKRWAQEEVTKAKQPPVVTTPTTPSAEDQSQAQLDGWMLDRIAKGLGMDTGAQLQDNLQFMRQMTESTADERVSMEFHGTCWDFPASPENTEKLFQTGINFGIIPANAKGEITVRPTAKQLAAAHYVAVQQGVYKPLTEDEFKLAQQSGPIAGPKAVVAPPITQGTQPESNPNTGNEWTMPIADLRAKILQGQR